MMPSICRQNEKETEFSMDLALVYSTDHICVHYSERGTDNRRRKKSRKKKSGNNVMGQCFRGGH